MASDDECVAEGGTPQLKKKKQKKVMTAAQLNMRGVFLHVMGDAIGSVVVIISALLVWLLPEDSSYDFKYYIDPALSIALVCIIVSTTIPLLRESSMILMMTVPQHLKVSDLKDKLMQEVKGM